MGGLIGRHELSEKWDALTAGALGDSRLVGLPGLGQHPPHRCHVQYKLRSSPGMIPSFLSSYRSLASTRPSFDFICF
jgi:hypothetical protein